ncbi:MAG: hypothetical protein K2I29_04065, partial [Clostridia bacterium]|nr:hypothetical protein [Clostridia bacterium]
MQESLDGNGKQVTFTLTENWTAQPDATYTTSFGSGVGFDNGRIAIPDGSDIVLNLGTFTIDRGLKNTEAITGGEVIKMLGSANLEVRGTTGKITGGNNIGYGGGIGCEKSTGTLTLTSGDITENTSKLDGGGVSVANLVMNGGSITKNTCTDAWGGGVSGSLTVVINGGVISENTANYGGGIATYNGKIEMHGGKISKNVATGGGGAGIYSRNSFIMTGGVIGGDTYEEGNVSKAYGGGLSFLSKAQLLGGTISHNTAISGGGIYTWSGTLTMEDGVLIDNNRATGRKEGSQGGGILLESIAQFTMNGGKITKNTSHKADGSTDNNATCGGIYINGSYFTMNGGEISENEADSEGGIGGWNSRITINDGAITLNKATVGTGGGVYVNLDGWLIMNGGEISNNTATTNGGGVVIVNAQTQFTMNGGTISGNIATTSDDTVIGNGGGVYTVGTFEMNGGIIGGNSDSDGNTARRGGGIYVADGTLTINGGTISHNTGSNGGGIYASRTSKIYFNDGEISSNTAPSAGGGIYIGTQLAYINGGEIKNNVADGTGGGGILLDHNTVLYISNCTITNNEATTGNGGGISIYGINNEYAQLILCGSVQIINNTAKGVADNVYVRSGHYIRFEANPIGSKIGVNMSTDGTFTSGYSSYLSGIAPSMFFFADNGKEIILTNGEAAIGTNAAPAAPTKSLTWQYRVSGGAWTTAPESLVYTGSSYEVQAVYVDGSTTTAQTIAKKTYHDVNGNTVSTIKNAGTYAFLVNSTEYKNASFVLHIKPVEITVEWDDSKIYYSGSMQIPTHTLKGVLDSDKNYVKAVLDTSRAGTNAGNNYSVSIAELTGTCAVNYKFATGAKTTHNYSILKAQTVNPVVNFTGTLYSSSKLPAISLSTGDTAGTIEWVTTSLKAGENVCEWKFTPASTDYTEQTGTYILYAEAIKPESIKATFNAGANTIYTTTTFEQLKSYIKLIAVNNDGSETEITDGSYTLYGELTEGTSNLSISYSGLATTVEIPNVQGGAKVTLSSLTAELTGTAKTDYTAFDKFNPAGVKVIATYSDGTTKQIADFTVAYADITKDYLCYGDTYVTIRYTDGEGTASYRLNGLTVVKAKPTVTPDISLSDRLIAGERLPKIALTDGDTDGNILWKETTLTEGTK